MADVDPTDRFVYHGDELKFVRRKPRPDTDEDDEPQEGDGA